ncbi:MAG: methyltransferase domain-containing protein [Candidatus Heimdallarchaeota archaeon]
MKTELPLMSDEMKDYFSDLLGKNLAENYLQKISSPMEDYTLHIFEDLSVTDEILEKFHENQFNAYVHKSFPNIIVSSPKGYFNIESTDDQKEMVVENRAAEMIYQGSDVFVPGVKRANKVKVGDLVKVVNQNDIHVANGKSLMKHHDILKEEHGIAAKNLISPYKVPGVEQLALQHHPVYFQSFPAFLSCINLNPKPDEKILDSCAAPGNKTIHLSELSNRKGKIIAVDRSKKRMKKLEDKLVKFNLKNIKTVVGDITKISKKWTIKFDKILIDPPCTSLGLRPRLVIECNKKNILSASQYQKSILYSCNQLLKDGGSMIYSTCTVTKEENEGIIDYAVTNLGLKVVEQDEVFSNIQSLVKGKEYPIQRFIPGKHNTLGYSITKLQK